MSRGIETRVKELETRRPRGRLPPNTGDERVYRMRLLEANGNRYSFAFGDSDIEYLIGHLRCLASMVEASGLPEFSSDPGAVNFHREVEAEYKDTLQLFRDVAAPMGETWIKTQLAQVQAESIEFAPIIAEAVHNRSIKTEEPAP